MVLEGITETHFFKWGVILAVCTLLYAAYRQYVAYTFIKKYGCEEPPNYPTGFLALPTLYDFYHEMKDGRMLEKFQGVIDETGNSTFTLYIAGIRIVLTTDPENIKAMLATQFNEFALGSRHSHFLPLLGDGIFTLDSHGWKNSRAMLRPQFSREQISHVRSLEPHVQTLMKHVRKANGATFDIQDLFFKFTVDTATEILFGESVHCLRDGSIDEAPPTAGFEGREEFNEAFNLTQRYLAMRSYSQSFYRFVDSKEFRNSCKTVHGFARYYVDKALAMDEETLNKKSENGYTFLYELAKSTRDPKALQDQLLNIMVAGRDTTAGLLSFTFFELSRRPDVWAELKEEIYASFGSGSDPDLELITFESLKKCEYLKWVLSEILRLYPSVPVNFRDATKDTVLPSGGGADCKSPVYVSKGTTVGYLPYCLHRQKEVFGEDSHEFKPERWAAQPKYGWNYVPFNGGPRICLGQQFALTEASYVVVRLAQEFPDLVTSYDGPHVPKKMLHLTLSLLNGVPVKMQ